MSRNAHKTFMVMNENAGKPVTRRAAGAARAALGEIGHNARVHDLRARPTRRTVPEVPELVAPCDARFDIDNADKGNPLAVAEYALEITQYNKSVESEYCPSPAYMADQPDINEKMRAILVDWLVEVHLKFKLMPEVLPLTINLIDRFLAKRKVVRSKLQLVGVTAMLIASKYEEIYAPEVRDFVYITDKAYTRDEILRMESQMLNALKFQCTVPTLHSFLARFVKAARLDKRGSTSMLARYLSERTLQEFGMLKYLPSTIAAACVHLALRKTGKPSWSDTLAFHTGYSEDDIRECAADVAQIAANAETTSLRAVRNKFSSSRYGSVGQIPWTRTSTAAAASTDAGSR